MEVAEQPNTTRNRTLLTRGRWNFLRSKWLPLLRDLHDTVATLDLEETALQKAEQEEAAAAAAKASRSEGGEAVRPAKCGDVHREIWGVLDLSY